jgi:hypothetical protein
MMMKAKKDMVVLHPFPRLEELDRDLDNDLRVKPFEQIKNGMYLRMALLVAILGEEQIFEPKHSFVPTNAEQQDEECDFGDSGCDIESNDDSELEKDDGEAPGKVRKEEVGLEEIEWEGKEDEKDSLLKDITASQEVPIALLDGDFGDL